jgi:hypothetical protein
MREPYKPRVAGSAHDVVSKLINNMGGIDRVAWLLGKKPHVVRAWTDPDQSHGGIGLEYATRLTQISGSPLIAELLAVHASAWLIAADPVSGDWHDLKCALTRQSYALLVQMVECNNAPSAHAARAMLGPVHELQRVVMTVRSHLIDAARG